ncbi:MAG TPA: hypothetical protein VGD49_13470 [Longimicrobiales bacterium]
MRRAATCIVLLVLAVGCIPQHRVERQLVTPGTGQPLNTNSRYLKAHMRDGSLFVLDGWKQEANEMQGTGVRLSVNRDTLATGALRVPIDSVLLFETNVLPAQNTKTPFVVFTVVTGIFGVICATSPKTCFGSCPTFYASDDQHILAEGFSASIAPALEATDVDKLAIAPVKDAMFTLRMTNEAMETHVIRSLRLLTFPARAGTQVVATARGEFWRVANAQSPECTGPEGSCTAAIRAADRVERFSPADSLDLAAREEIELQFVTPKAGEYALVLKSRQTLLHTYVFYQTLAYLGSQAGEYLASLSRGNMQRFNSLMNLGRAMGGIDVGKPDSREKLEMVYETGPLATDAHLIKLGVLTRGPHTVRLRMAKGHWRIDQLSIVSMIEKLEPIAIDPSEVTHNGKTDATALEALLTPASTLASIPGDEFKIGFKLPKYPEGAELFLEARGYYLEWMREAWMREENAERASMMLDDPARGLREIAPEFKKWEPRMESLFWSSRYVRN